jgi:hypothetical protein
MQHSIFHKATIGDDGFIDSINVKGSNITYKRNEMVITPNNGVSNIKQFTDDGLYAIMYDNQTINLINLKQFN